MCDDMTYDDIHLASMVGMDDITCEDLTYDDIMCDDVTCDDLHLVNVAGMDDITYDDLNPEFEIMGLGLMI